MRFSKFLILITCVGGFNACGELPENIDATYRFNGRDISAAPPCAACAVVEASVFRPTPTVAVYPEDLMFYGDSSATDGLEPQKVRVTNATSSTVLVSNVYIVDDGDTTTGEGGGAYFSVSTVADLDRPLAPDDAVEFEVSFSLSSTQRSAFLVIETTHASYSSLVVTLYGKFFDW